MLTRFVRNQLIIFTVTGVTAITLMVMVYMQVPTLLGLGKISVTVELPRSGGLYRFSNVTYRGVQIGKVTDITVVEGKRVQAMLSLDSSPRVPADASAVVRSVSAVGEQFVDLQPPDESGPYLHDGSIIPADRTSLPQQVGPMLDQVSALVSSIPKERLSDLLDESFNAFNGAGEDFSSLLDSSSAITGGLNDVADQTRQLVDQGAPLLDTQVASADALRVWARSLAGASGQLVEDDPQLRTVLTQGPGLFDEAARLLEQIRPTLPVLLANLTSIGQIAVTYHASLEQLLVLLPPSTAVIQSSGGANNATGIPMGDFSLTVGDPPACTVGFLPPSQWRSPADVDDTDTPDGLYCKLPQDSPIAVRGARNYPCMGRPGKRAPTVEICNSDQPYSPLAMRQHATGPYPFDPNAIAQGVAPDDRTTFQDHIFGPLDGTPPPPGPATPQTAPSAFGSADAAPSVAVATYDPHTGTYTDPQGRLFRQADLTAGTTGPRSWTDLVLNP